MRIFTITLAVLLLAAAVSAEQRFAVPTQFDSGYTKPTAEFPNPRPSAMQYVDLAMLVATLSLAAFLTLRLRRRGPIFALTIFCLVYFGFVRGGCVCPIGAIQHVSMTIFQSAYAIPLIVLAFFVIPLVFTLFFGRVFCGSVCPLGAVQDVVLVRPLRVPGWLEEALGLGAWVYLVAAVLLAATGSAFIICQYDPFVSLFRLAPLGKWIEGAARGWAVPGGIWNITVSVRLLVLSGAMLVVCMFVGRAYCRFLCPYGAILRVLSALSLYRVRIAPCQCIDCNLCADVCPFGAIRTPDSDRPAQNRTRGKGLLVATLLAWPVLVIASGWGASLLSPYLAMSNARVSLADQIRREQAGLKARSDNLNDPGEIFRQTNTPVAGLYDEADGIRRRFHFGSWLAGGFLGLIIGGKLVRLSVRRRRIEYEADRATCLACGRCFASCPLEQARREGRDLSLTADEDG